MPGWSRAKRQAFEKAFYVFLDNTYIDSKDTGGRTCLGKHITWGQRHFVSRVLDGLEQDIHDFYVLKSRQLGLSTISRALSTFYLGAVKGLRGATVFDTTDNRDEARREIVNMIEEVPKSMKLPELTGNNRAGIALANTSSLAFMSAGVKKSKTSGGLGRSRGLSFLHASEICSWDNTEGVESLRNALSDINPDRLYIWESTGRGYNSWRDMWIEARKDPAHKMCIFLGWWSKDSQRIDRDNPDFERYGIQPPNEKEAKKIQEVKELYDFDITPEQLAWVRKKMDPAQEGDDDDGDLETKIIRLQEQPWTEHDAFQVTGSVFFTHEDLDRVASTQTNKKFKAYSYICGMEFYDCKVMPAFNAKMTELKVWEPPEEGSVYIVAADPAYGHDDRNDRSAIQVLRAYSDGLDQVAEYAWPLVNTSQFAWVIASLLGWYGGERSECYFILEMNGPGEAVWNAFNALKTQVQFGYHKEQFQERGLEAIFRNVKNYIYTRSDSMSAGHTWQWQTQTRLKISIMERLRDFVSNGMLKIVSMETIEEMRYIARDGDSIEASGSKKDDRVLTLAMAVRVWDERVRRKLIRENRTRAAEKAKRSANFEDQMLIFNKTTLSNFFEAKQAERRAAARAAMQARWKTRR